MMHGTLSNTGTRLVPAVVPAAFVLAGCGQEAGSGASAGHPAAHAHTLVALEHFEKIQVDGYVPSYRDEERGALAANSILYENQFDAAEAMWRGPVLPCVRATSSGWHRGRVRTG